MIIIILNIINVIIIIMIIASRLSLVSRLFIITRNMGCYRSENTFTLISLDFNFAYLPVLNIYIFVIFYNYILYIHTRRNAAEISIDLKPFYIYLYSPNDNYA